MKNTLMSLVALSALAVAMPAAAQDTGQGRGGQRDCSTAQDPAACRERQAQRGDGQGGQRGDGQGRGQGGSGQGGSGQGGSGQQGSGQGSGGGQQGGSQSGGSQSGGSQSSGGQQGSGQQSGGGRGQGGQSGQGGSQAGGGQQSGGQQSGGWDRDDRGQDRGGWDRGDNRGNDRGGRGDDRDGRGWDRNDDRGIAVGEINGDNFNGAYNQIERKIERGFKTGQLDRRTAWNLALQLGEARKLDRMFRRDGRIDRRERNELMARIARMDAQLRYVRMDGGPRRY